LSARLARIEALRVWTERAAKRETREEGVEEGAVGALQHRAAWARGSLGDIVGGVVTMEVDSSRSPSLQSRNQNQSRKIARRCCKPWRCGLCSGVGKGLGSWLQLKSVGLAAGTGTFQVSRISSGFTWQL